MSHIAFLLLLLVVVPSGQLDSARGSPAATSAIATGPRPAREKPASATEPHPPPAPPAKFELPRPNLGPEPWPEPTFAWYYLLVPLWAAPIAAIAWHLRKRRSVRAEIPADRHADGVDDDPSPMANWARLVRDAIVTRFGPPCAAKTTEELATMPELTAHLGPELAEQLVAFLRAADHIKFGENADDRDQGTVWEDWVAAFFGAPAATATSTITGPDPHRSRGRVGD